MSVIIGTGNFEFLSRIVGYLLSYNRGKFQENPEIEVLKKRGRFCQYDQCPDKKIKTDRFIKVNWDNGLVRYEAYAFHADCLDFLLTDQRFIP